MRAAKEPPILFEEVGHLSNQMLSFDHVSSYQGILSLCHHLYLADLNTKLELTRKIMILVYSHPNAPGNIYKQVGWQGCIGRLLVKEVVQPELDSVVSVEDVISIDDDLHDPSEPVDHQPMSPTHYINKVNILTFIFICYKAEFSIKTNNMNPSFQVTDTARRVPPWT